MLAGSSVKFAVARPAPDVQDYLKKDDGTGQMRYSKAKVGTAAAVVGITALGAALFGKYEYDKHRNKQASETDSEKQPLAAVDQPESSTQAN